jgi:hypothetical protein
MRMIFRTYAALQRLNAPGRRQLSTSYSKGIGIPGLQHIPVICLGILPVPGISVDFNSRATTAGNCL